MLAMCVHFQSDTHHDDSHHQSSQADEVELLGEQQDQLIVAALRAETEDEDASGSQRFPPAALHTHHLTFS